MDLLKSVVYLLFFSVSMNLFMGMLPYAGITPPFTGNLTANDPDPGGLVDSWAGGDQAFYDIGTGVFTFWTAINVLIQGVPAMLQAFGVPFWITEPLYWYYRLLWLSAIALGVIAGRST